MVNTAKCSNSVDDTSRPYTLVIEIDRATEREAIGEAYDTFSGLYQAPVKSAAIRMLAESTTYDKLWVRPGIFHVIWCV